jgi:transcriptional regulator with XRE-family HTH domain
LFLLFPLAIRRAALYDATQMGTNWTRWHVAIQSWIDANPERRTYAALGRRVGVTGQTVSRWLSHGHTPTMATLARVQVVTGVDAKLAADPLPMKKQRQAHGGQNDDSE